MNQGAEDGDESATPAAAADPQQTPTLEAAVNLFRHVWRWHQAAANTSGLGAATFDATLRMTRNSDVRGWSNRLHQAILTPVAQISNPSRIQPTEAFDMTDIAHSFSEAAGAYERSMTTAASERAQRLPGYSKLPKENPQMILRAMTSDGEEPRKTPPKTLTEFMSKHTAAFVYDWLTDKLSTMIINCQTVPGTVTSMYSGLWASKTPGIPGNLSIWGFPVSQLSHLTSEGALAANM
uniref:Uncharacterized protein n=1 Tax=Odontella aurita TaxID=265563 RepID=A0A7S4JYV6_9STRA|mmetsp:Transcript_5733/g.16537  ORF Transcript_5733/g.16537 Transcript_5733/m.16537 type:complete len:237 (+) Transcript_5733:267-977(+)